MEMRSVDTVGEREGGTKRVALRHIAVVQPLNHVQLFDNPWIAAYQASLSFTISQSLLKLMSIESVMPSYHLLHCCPPLLLSSVFSSTRWPNYSFSIRSSGLISFQMDWFDLLEVQGTLKSLLQHHSSKASILQHSAFFMIQFSRPFLTTGKTTALTT